jgi:hypothetical protein
MLSKIWLPWVPLEITVGNKVPTRIFSLETLFLTVYFQVNLGKPYFIDSSCFEKGSQQKYVQ